ncbi:hypothetical protein [Terribacillus saccharophilus]|uniref:hypothetical protein n=1 Tax=Terribacillus saccharophilus TaxID=361277 RepID=UPI002989C4AA|nr:hypothetical protein [Terribacillus saccharophilus]MCM3227563.1 hypothetical protein [Terribacillus saccharophilus]
MNNLMTTLYVKGMVVGAANPFTGIKSFLNKLFTDVATTATIIFGIGFLFCALMAWRGSEENVPRFQKGMVWTGGAAAVAALAKVIVSWVQGGVA